MPRLILHVDDDAGQREVFKEMLSLMGFEVLSFASVQEALTRAKKRKPDAIILDAMMPGVDGFTACRLIRAEEDLRSIPIMMVTSLDRLGDVEKAFNSGANEYVIKPADFARLQAKLAKMLGCEGKR